MNKQLEYEDIPLKPKKSQSKGTPHHKKTVSKSGSIKRPTDLSSLHQLKSKIGKLKPTTKSKPTKKKNGTTQSKSKSSSSSQTKGNVTWTMLRPQFLMHLSEGKSSKGITTSMSTNYTYSTVVKTKKFRGLKSLYMKSKFYLAVVVLVGLAWLSARTYLDNWLQWGAFYISLWFIVETILKRGNIK